MDQQQIMAIIRPVLNHYNVPDSLVKTIIQVESGWNPSALGDNGTSIGLFQLHIGGQADQAIRDGHSFASLADPGLNATYAMPAIASAWTQLASQFNASNFSWWLDFAARSGHPGGSADNPVTVHEASALMGTYKMFNTVFLNGYGCIADLPMTDQFVPGQSAYECVAYAVALCKHAGQANHGSIGSAQDVTSDARYWYGKLTGSNASWNTSVMTLDEMHTMLNGLTMRYYVVGSAMTDIKRAVATGHPVIIQGTEEGYHDLDFGDAVPYPWTPVGGHAVVVIGVARDGNLLIADSANIDSNGKLRPWPRRYDAGKMQLFAGTGIIYSWSLP